jgi:hypothetical protein
MAASDKPGGRCAVFGGKLFGDRGLDKPEFFCS